MSESMKGKEGLQTSQNSVTLQRRLQQVQTQLADAETRAASHFVILQQHQQRKDIQEKKAAALQHRLSELQAQTEAGLIAAQEELEARLSIANQQADDRCFQQLLAPTAIKHTHCNSLMP